MPPRDFLFVLQVCAPPPGCRAGQQVAFGCNACLAEVSFLRTTLEWPWGIGASGLRLQVLFSATQQVEHAKEDCLIWVLCWLSLIWKIASIELDSKGIDTCSGARPFYRSSLKELRFPLLCSGECRAVSTGWSKAVFEDRILTERDGWRQACRGLLRRPRCLFVA